MLKAWNVYPGSGPYDDGCFLVFATTRGKAKNMGLHAGVWGADYCDMNARRVPDMDCHAMLKAGREWVAMSNSDLPADSTFYDGTEF